MIKHFQIWVIYLILFILLTSCSPLFLSPTLTVTPIEPTVTPNTITPTPTEPTVIQTTMTPTPTKPTATPTSCTGWQSNIAGVVYAEVASAGNELEGVPVTLHQMSFCSPTAGEYQTITGVDGTFQFDDIYIHDTDTINILIDHEGYKPFQLKIGGLEYYNYGLDEIVLEKNPDS